MKEGIEFSYNGIKSVDMGLINVQIDGGMFEEPFLAEREINEVSIRGRDKPYFQYVRKLPLSFTLSFAFEDNYNEQKIREVARWLSQDYYKPFFTIDNPERIFYCILVSDSRLLHNGLKEGYVEIEMRCDSPYSYSPIYTTPIYDFTKEVNDPIVITNTGDLVCKPEMWIKKVGDGALSIVNKTDNNRYFSFLNGSNAQGVFKFTGSVTSGEKIMIGKDTYEFYTGDEPISNSNIKVDISHDTSFAKATLTFTGDVVDGEKIIIGKQKYEFDTDDNFSFDSYKVDISPYSNFAKTTLTFAGNPSAGEILTIGDTTYTFVVGTKNLAVSNTILIKELTEDTIDCIVAAINDIGTRGLQYGKGTVEHSSVIARKINDNKLEITAKNIGVAGNNITVTTNSANISLSSSTTIGGNDCSKENAIQALVNRINHVSPKEYRVLNSDGDKIELISSVSGDIGNEINVSSECNNATWDNDVFTGGKSASISTILTELENMMNIYPPEITAVKDLENNSIAVTYQGNTEGGNILVSDTVYNGYWENFSLTGGKTPLLDGETVYIDNENEYIKSDSGLLRYDIFNGNFLELQENSINELVVYGKCQIVFRYRFKTLQG